MILRFIVQSAGGFVKLQDPSGNSTMLTIVDVTVMPASVSFFLEYFVKASADS